MGYDYDEERGKSYSKQKDLVLNINEFAFILSKTDGNIKVATGPYQTSLSQQEVPVLFDKKTKRFVECDDYDEAKQIFTSAPEGWYVVLKNPVSDERHPEAGKTNQSPTNMLIGTKINIQGPVSFALFPGQMAKVLQGHRLRSNQYLLARVYDADAANKNAENAVIATTDDSVNVTNTKSYFAGQLIIIKGTEVSFYIPPTGIEIIPDRSGRLVREAVTVERLEYCILKDENGNKRYMHGPCVVFPEPTETFIKNSEKDDSYCFNAIELSPTSGIYIKVIAPYEENGVSYSTGEELFITGNEQMIYYPRPEHAIIKYGDNTIHYAIAIPEGEGRYIMNKLTGEIRTVYGPAMYLPDPRKETMVKRKLTRTQCELWYPNNEEVLKYNLGITSITDTIKEATCSYNADICTSTKAIFNRPTSYTPPKSITFDNKFDGAVTINVWTGYAINCISKTGERTVIVGPATKLLDYGENLETLELSTGKPKTTDCLYKTVYLRIDNNKVSDIINVQTSDFVNVNIKVSYTVDFLKEYQDRWFSVENYVKYFCDRMRSLVKEIAHLYSIEEFYNDASLIVRSAILNTKQTENEDEEFSGRLFEENGMFIKDVDVLSVKIEGEVADIFEKHQVYAVKRALELTEQKKDISIIAELNTHKKRNIALEDEIARYRIELAHNREMLELANEDAENEKRAEINMKERKEEELKAEAEKALADLRLKTAIEESNARLEEKERKTAINIKAQEAQAEAVEIVANAFSPDLIAAMNDSSNRNLVTSMMENISPYALANGKSVAETVSTLLRGNSFESVVRALSPIVKTSNNEN